jgi:hypothetical protein
MHAPTPRREFLHGAALAAAATSSLLAAKPATAETKVQSLYRSLDDTQRKAICFPFAHDLRLRVENNWHITKSRIDKDFNSEQRVLIDEIFTDLHSERYGADVRRQVEEDNADDGGFGGCAIAIFGEPGTGKFEFVFTGRHTTRRCDGDSVEGAAFGGPIFYGHSPRFSEKPDHAGNAYWFQGKRANVLFQALDGKQRDLALVTQPPRERGTKTVELGGERRGISAEALSGDQKELARAVMSDLLAPFREADAAEAMRLIDARGFDTLNFSYFKDKDIGKDGVWDVWMVEGPSMRWYFRGAPHVHTWVHVRA